MANEWMNNGVLNAPEEEVPEPHHVGMVQPFQERQLSAFPPFHLQQKMQRIEMEVVREYSEVIHLSVTCQHDFESEVFAVPPLTGRWPRSRILSVDFSDTGAEHDAEASDAKNAAILRAKNMNEFDWLDRTCFYDMAPAAYES